VWNGSWNESAFLRYRQLMVATQRGHIERLPSGSYRVHVYAGIDPVTHKPRRLKQTCPDEPSAVIALGTLLRHRTPVVIAASLA
jgi:hypothetical protein